MAKQGTTAAELSSNTTEMAENPLHAENFRTSSAGWLTLFVATGTLICCALPIALVALGFGAAVAALTSSIPLLITLSEYKEWTLSVSGALLFFTGWLIYRSGQPCPADPELAALCQRWQTRNRRIYWVSAIIWGAGFFAAYLLLPVAKWLGY